MDPFHIFTLLPPDARVFIVLGNGGYYLSIGRQGRVPAEVSAALLTAAQELRAMGCSTPTAIYDRDQEARVEFVGDLDGLVLHLHAPDAITGPWGFSGLTYDTGRGEYPPEGLRRLQAVAAFVATLPFVAV